MSRTPHCDRHLRLAPAVTLAAGLCFAVGGLGLVAGFFLVPVHFIRAWLLGWTAVLALALGSLTLLMLQYLITSRWGGLLRRILEAAALQLPLLALLFIPLLFGLPHLYPWAVPEEVAHDHLLQHKQAYLNPMFFILRGVIYFSIWSLLAWRLRKVSRVERPFGQADRPAGFALSAGGMVALFLTFLFASTDLWMSLEPHWFSSIYAVQVLIGFALMALSAATLSLIALRRHPVLARHLDPKLWNDLGNMLLAFTMLWTYMSFMQFLIIWSANLPEDVTWYTARTRGGWLAVVIVLALGHFAMPFFALLSRRAKQSVRTLTGIATLILVMHLVNLIWMIVPAFSPAVLRVHWLHPFSLLFFGGLFTLLAGRRLRALSLLPPASLLPASLSGDRAGTPAQGVQT